MTRSPHDSTITLDPDSFWDDHDWTDRDGNVHTLEEERDHWLNRVRS